MGFAKDKSAATEYEDQKKYRGRTPPVIGTFHVVNTKLQWQAVGTGTEKLSVSFVVLKPVKAENTEGAKAMVRKTYRFDIWWHKPANENPPDMAECDFNLIVNREGDGLGFNGKKLLHLAYANGLGADEDISEKIAARDIVDIVTGVPYLIEIDVKTRETKRGEAHDIEPLVFKALVRDKRKVYTDNPGWEKLVPKKEDRLLEDADFTSSGGQQTKTRKPARDDEDDGFFDDELPF